MNTQNPEAKEYWKRPVAAVTGPNRSFGGYYRSADRAVSGKVFRGVPLQTAEDAVVAAVRLGYRVVDAQIERGMRIAKDLQDANTRSGGGDGKQTLDGTERIINKAVLFGLQWLEGAAADPGHPVRRLLAAEYRMLGSLFGLSGDGEGPAARKEKTNEPDSVSSTPAAGSVRRVIPRITIRHSVALDQRRPVKKIVTWEIYGAIPAEGAKVNFHLVEPEDTARPAIVMDGEIWLERGGKTTLRVESRLKYPRGRWCAGIYGNDGEQVGLVEVLL